LPPTIRELIRTSWVVIVNIRSPTAVKIKMASNAPIKANPDLFFKRFLISPAPTS
jgi:hypothetical protein